jgi:hypothetical protein
VQDDAHLRGPAAGSRPLYDALVDGLHGSAVLASADALNYRPLELRGLHPLPPLLRVYLYKMTSPLAERQVGAYRIQITLPGQRRGRGHFDWSDGAFVVLVGYEADLDVFAFWDAALYDGPEGIPFSRNCQVLDSTLYRAMVTGVSDQPRRLKAARVNEVVVAASRSDLTAGLLRRMERTWDRAVTMSGGIA